jgi:hypothetical protein
MWIRNRVGLVTTAVVALAGCATSSQGTLGVQQEEAYLEAMQSDLRHLASFQEVYYGDVYTYADDLSLLAFAASSGVAIGISEATASGWAAVVTHEGLPGRGCAVHYGSVEPIRTPRGQVVERAGEIVCDPR